MRDQREVGQSRHRIQGGGFVTEGENPVGEAGFFQYAEGDVFASDDGPINYPSA